jgi:DNA-binding MarR family transcriptional regulator
VADLTTLQFGALLYLSKQPGSRGVEQNKLAHGMDVDRNSASLLVEQMVVRGLVERRVNGADRRVRLLSLTTKGKKLLARLEPEHLAANERILAPLSHEERELLFSLLIRVIDDTGGLARPVSDRR